MRDIHIHVLNEPQPWSLTVDTELSFSQELYNIEVAIRENSTYRIPSSRAFINGRYIVSVTTTAEYSIDQKSEPPF